MGALSPYSSIFSNVQKELTERVNAGQLQTKNERINFVRNKGLDINDFREAQ